VRLAITRGHPPMRISHCSATATVAPQGQPPHRRPCAHIRTTRRLHHQDLATWGSVPEITSRESAGRSATTAETSAGAAKDDPPALQVWEGGGDGVVAPADPAVFERLRVRWEEETQWNLELRWQLATELFVLERDRVGLTEDWKFGWTNTKSYVGITYMWETRGEIFLSKYVVLDPCFVNFLGCLRHELAHALAGPPGDHGQEWSAAAAEIGCPPGWATATTRSFYNRPWVVIGWSAHDVAAAAGRAFTLPPELFEKNVWAADGCRTIFTDADGNVVM